MSKKPTVGIRQCGSKCGICVSLYKQIPLDNIKGPTRTSGATTVTLSTAMALRCTNDKVKIHRPHTLAKTHKKRSFSNITLGSDDQFPDQNFYCWPAPISILCLEKRSHNGFSSESAASTRVKQFTGILKTAGDDDKKQTLTVRVRRFGFGFPVLLVVPKINCIQF